MKKGICFAIRIGLSIRSMINKNGCNDISFHLFNNGESVLESTYIRDNKYKSRFKINCLRCKELTKTPRGKKQ